MFVMEGDKIALFGSTLARRFADFPKGVVIPIVYMWIDEKNASQVVVTLCHDPPSAPGAKNHDSFVMSIAKEEPALLIHSRVRP